MFCPKCDFRVRDPMAIKCEQCGYDFSAEFLGFLPKFDKWLSERVSDGDISEIRANFLLHLASKYIRNVQIIDGWAKAPRNVNARNDDNFINISAGEVQQIGDSDIYISNLEQAWDVFPLREFMDDPYVRIIIREDIPIVESNAVLKAITNLFKEKEISSQPVAKDIQSTEYEYFDFEWRAERGETFGRVTAKKGFNQNVGEALTEPYARLHFWQGFQVQILEQLQSFLDDGWQPVTEVGPGCIEIVASHQWDPEVNMRSFLRSFSPQWFFVGLHIKLRRPKS